MRPSRLALGLVIAATVLTGATACVDNGGSASPTGTATVVISPSPSGPTASANTGSPTASATSTSALGYPSDARTYADAVLAAWKNGQQSRLADLSTATVVLQLQGTTGLDSNWSYVQCQGAAGSSFCQYFNNNGDAITIRVINQFLGQPHAVSEVQLDITKYETTADAYVKAFIEAWRSINPKRMSVLANDNEQQYFMHYTPPDTYSTCIHNTGGSVVDVRVYNAAGLNYTISVSVPTLGHAHAIVGHTNPASPVC